MKKNKCTKDFLSLTVYNNLKNKFYGKTSGKAIILSIVQLPVSRYYIHQFDRFAYIHKCAAKQGRIYGISLLYSWNGIEPDWFCCHRTLL